MGPAEIAVLIPIVSVISVFTFLTVIIVKKSADRRAEREKLYDVARAAVEKGQPLPPEVIGALGDMPAAKRTAFSDLRAGVICLSVGVGIIAFGAILGIEERDAFHPLVGIGCIPALVGVALIVLSYFNPNKERRG